MGQFSNPTDHTSDLPSSLIYKGISNPVHCLPPTANPSGDDKLWVEAELVGWAPFLVSRWFILFKSRSVELVGQNTFKSCLSPLHRMGA